MSVPPLQHLTVHLASDHAGFAFKEALKQSLKDNTVTVVDHGALHFEAEDDYPDFIKLAVAAVSKDPERNRAIIFGGSGQGEAMLANRFRGVRAAVFYGGDELIVPLSRQHNDANVLSFGARFTDLDTVIRLSYIWLQEPFNTEEKYQRRNRKIEQITREVST